MIKVVFFTQLSVTANNSKPSFIISSSVLKGVSIQQLTQEGCRGLMGAELNEFRFKEQKLASEDATGFQ